jgi:lactate permease
VTDTTVSLTLWLLAVLPIVVLVTLVASGRLKTVPAAGATLALVVVIAATAFRTPGPALGYAVGKGLWTGLWILCVVWTALLLHAACQAMGMGTLGGLLAAILPRGTENVLVAAWIFPSFVQGVAGFGTPIVVSAPLLLSMGLSRVKSVALPLIGYNWAVGFGSVGSSFYMGALTARLSGTETHQYALTASVLLGANAILSGVLVAMMHAGRKGLAEGWRLIVVAGPLMAVTQALVVHFEPAVGALAGGTAGLVVVAVRAVRHHTAQTSREDDARATDEHAALATVTARSAATPAAGRPGTVTQQADTADEARSSFAHLALVMLPYGLLLITVLAVLLPSASRTWVKSHLAWGPSFPSATTGRGVSTPAVHSYQSIALLAHPGTFILIATALSVVFWMLRGHWPSRGLRTLGPTWVRAALRSSWPVLLLACVATVMSDAGMVRAIAVGVSEVTGAAYPPLAGLVGAVGSFTTGSTTSSNALFAGLQANVARLIHEPASTLLAAQLSGGNVGNSVAPVVIVMGAAAVGARDKVGEIFRAVIVPASVLLLTVVMLTVLFTVIR